MSREKSGLGGTEGRGLEGVTEAFLGVSPSASFGGMGECASLRGCDTESGSMGVEVAGVASTEGRGAEARAGDSDLLRAASLESWQICVLGNVQTRFIH